MTKNLFYQFKKNLFNYAVLPTLAIISSCSLNKEFVEDDLYYSPKDDKPRTEISYLDSIKGEIPVDTIKIESINDLNYAVRNGADANLYWENYFIYSPYSSSLGWDWDGDGIVNAFDLNPWRYDFFDDINNNGISDELEFGSYFFTNLDFIYWDLYYNYPLWRRGFYYDSYWNSLHGGNNGSSYYFPNSGGERVNYPVRRRALSTLINEEKEENIRRDVINSRENNINENQRQRTTRYIRPTQRNEGENYVPERNLINGNKRYERPNTRERTNINYDPQTRSTRQTRNIYSPNTRTHSIPTTTKESTRTRSSGITVGSGSSSGSSHSSGTTSSSSKSSNSSRRGRRR
jgi:hypothetical protein